MCLSFANVVKTGKAILVINALQVAVKRNTRMTDVEKTAEARRDFYVAREAKAAAEKAYNFAYDVYLAAQVGDFTVKSKAKNRT